MKQTGHKRDMPVMVRRKMGLCSAQLPFKSTGGGLKGHLRGGGGQKEKWSVFLEEMQIQERLTSNLHTLPKA